MAMKQAQCKLCRREGKKLMLKGERCESPKCAIVKRNYAPGASGAKNMRRKVTEYGTQLREKQKAKRIYGIYEGQFKKYYDKAMKAKTETAESLITTLEMRLDNVIFRAGIAKSRRQARQLVNHGHFFVNKFKTDIPSYQVKTDDIIKIKESKENITFFKTLKEELKKKKEVEAPGWIAFDKSKMEIKILSKPNVAELDKGFDPKMIIEFYSR
jgi:small subunit ribosomal protein S4